MKIFTYLDKSFSILDDKEFSITTPYTKLLPIYTTPSQVALLNSNNIRLTYFDRYYKLSSNYKLLVINYASKTKTVSRGKGSDLVNEVEVICNIGKGTLNNRNKLENLLDDWRGLLIIDDNKDWIFLDSSRIIDIIPKPIKLSYHDPNDLIHHHAIIDGANFYLTK